jgi:hypothetical protein
MDILDKYERMFLDSNVFGHDIHGSIDFQIALELDERGLIKYFPGKWGAPDSWEITPAGRAAFEAAPEPPVLDARVQALVDAARELCEAAKAVNDNVGLPRPGRPTDYLVIHDDYVTDLARSAEDCRDALAALEGTDKPRSGYDYDAANLADAGGME